MSYLRLHFVINPCITALLQGALTGVVTHTYLFFFLMIVSEFMSRHQNPANE